MRSIRVYLFALVAIALILATIAFALVIARADALNRQQVEAQTRETAKALSQAVDGKLERAMGVLAALRSSDAALSHDWRKLDAQARKAMPDGDAWIVVQDRSGGQLVNTRLPAGSPLPRGAPAAEMWKELTGGKPRVCNLTRGFVEPRIVCVDAPIGSDAHPDYAISVIFRPEAFGSIITRYDVRAGNIATLVDRSGKVIWRNIKPDQFIGHGATSSMRNALRSGAPSGVLETTSLEGVQMLSGFSRSALSGWSVIVGSPIAQIDSASREALKRGSALAAVMLLLGVLIAALMGAKLARAVQGLEGVSDPRPGDREAFKPTGIDEIDAVGGALTQAFAERDRSERHQQILIGELNHRVKNTLSIVQSLAHQTFRDRQSPDQAIAAFEGRLQALAAAHNLLTKQRWEAASMVEVVRSTIAPFCDPRRCDVQGPDVKVSPQTAVTLALALHELATNASKYGALSTDTGRVKIDWEAEGQDFRMTWQEMGGPPVRVPNDEGFGMRLIRRSLAAELRGEVNMDFAESGLICRIAGRLA